MCFSLSFKIPFYIVCAFEFIFKLDARIELHIKIKCLHYEWQIGLPPCYPYKILRSLLRILALSLNFSDRTWTCEKLIFMIHGNKQTNNKLLLYSKQCNEWKTFRIWRILFKAVGWCMPYKTQPPEHEYAIPKKAIYNIYDCALCMCFAHFVFHIVLFQAYAMSLFMFLNREKPSKMKFACLFRYIICGLDSPICCDALW